MSPTQIASLSLKILGIYCIIKALPMLGASPGIFAFADYDSMYMFWGAVLPFILEFGAGVFLIAASNKLASKMTVADEKDIQTNQLTGSALQTIAFSILGIAMIAWAIPEVGKILANIQLLKNAGDELPEKSMAIGTKAYAIAITIQCIVGLALFFGAKGLSSIWLFMQRQRPMSKTNTYHSA